jgi:formylmethanofuran dehydrogenase subunit E
VNENNETHMGCDRCGRYVANGDGLYIDDDRVCAECYNNEGGNK